jgi:hypothetical protein
MLSNANEISARSWLMAMRFARNRKRAVKIFAIRVFATVSRDATFQKSRSIVGSRAIFRLTFHFTIGSRVASRGKREDENFNLIKNCALESRERRNETRDTATDEVVSLSDLSSPIRSTSSFLVCARLFNDLSSQLKEIRHGMSDYWRFCLLSLGFLLLLFHCEHV